MKTYVVEMLNPAINVHDLVYTNLVFLKSSPGNVLKQYLKYLGLISIPNDLRYAEKQTVFINIRKNLKNCITRIPPS